MSNVHSTELWRPIPEFPGYEVSNIGRVRSKKQQTAEWRLMRPHRRKRTKKGLSYVDVVMRQDGRTVTKLVHVLVLTAFVGPALEGMECRHLDNDPGNNRLENLEWGTHQQNMLDKVKYGTNAGENHSGSKLTVEDVKTIRRLVREGKEHAEVADLFGICRPTVSLIVNRRTWRHVKDEECPQSPPIPLRKR